MEGKQHGRIDVVHCNVCAWDEQFYISRPDGIRHVYNLLVEGRTVLFLGHRFPARIVISLLAYQRKIRLLFADQYTVIGEVSGICIHRTGIPYHKTLDVVHVLEVNHHIPVWRGVGLTLREPPWCNGERRACNEIECVARYACVVERGENRLADAHVAVGAGRRTRIFPVNVQSIQAYRAILLSRGPDATFHHQFHVPCLHFGERDVLLCLVGNILLMCQERPRVGRLHLVIQPVFGNIATVGFAVANVTEHNPAYRVYVGKLHHYPWRIRGRVAPLASLTDITCVEVERALPVIHHSAVRMDVTAHLARAKPSHLVYHSFGHPVGYHQRVAHPLRGSRVVHCHSYERVGTTVIQEPLVPVVCQSFYEYRSCGILPALLKVCHGTEEGLVEAVKQFQRVFPAE